MDMNKWHLLILNSMIWEEKHLLQYKFKKNRQKRDASVCSQYKMIHNIFSLHQEHARVLLS